ncbi:MAG: class I SAM-dependent methyltransferase [Bacteroidota bacterium]
MTEKTPGQNRPTKAIRKQYEELGVDKFYRRHGAAYENPHFPYIRQLLLQNKERIDFSRILDFCCGGGEVSRVALELGAEQLTASDPFTAAAFRKHIGQPCLKWSFEDVIRGKMEGAFSAIICSFAMHLCEPKQLYPLTHALLAHSPLLVIITPHKRPPLEDLDGIALAFEDFVLTAEKGKKVRLKAYCLEPRG